MACGNLKKKRKKEEDNLNLRFFPPAIIIMMKKQESYFQPKLTMKSSMNISIWKRMKYLEKWFIEKFIINTIKLTFWLLLWVICCWMELTAFDSLHTVRWRLLSSFSFSKQIFVFGTPFRFLWTFSQVPCIWSHIRFPCWNLCWTEAYHICFEELLNWFKVKQFFSAAFIKHYGCLSVLS